MCASQRLSTFLLLIFVGLVFLCSFVIICCLQEIFFVDLLSLLTYTLDLNCTRSTHILPFESFRPLVIRSFDGKMHQRPIFRNFLGELLCTMEQDVGKYTINNGTCARLFHIPAVPQAFHCVACSCSRVFF